MSLGRHLDLGALAQGSSLYTGHHRDGVGLIPLGNRERVISEYGIDSIEERDSLDKYSKYSQRREP